MVPGALACLHRLLDVALTRSTDTPGTIARGPHQSGSVVVPFVRKWQTWHCRQHIAAEHFAERPSRAGKCRSKSRMPPARSERNAASLWAGYGVPKNYAVSIKERPGIADSSCWVYASWGLANRLSPVPCSTILPW